MEPDDYLLRLLRDPQAVENGPDIRPLDAETLRDAFSLKEGPVPGVCCIIDRENTVRHYADERCQFFSLMLPYWEQMILAIIAEEMDTYQHTLEAEMSMDKVMVISEYQRSVFEMLILMLWLLDVDHGERKHKKKVTFVEKLMLIVLY